MRLARVRVAVLVALGFVACNRPAAAPVAAAAGADLALPDDAGPPPPDAARPDDAGPPAVEGGGDGGWASIQGEMNGYSVTAVRSVFAVVGGAAFAVYISDRADLCAVLQASASAHDTAFLRLGATADAPQGFPSGVYSYPSGPGSGAGDGTGQGRGGVDGGITGTHHAVIARSDDRCVFEGYDQAAWGEFEIDAPVDATTTTISGRFDVTFGVGAVFGEIQGQFVAPVCPRATDVSFEWPLVCE
jgi:hypothetical protein